MRLFIKRLASRFKTKLPVGMAEFELFCDDIIELSGKFADRDSMVYVIASTLIHMKPDMAFVPKDYFVRILRKAAASQVASQAFQDVKMRQDQAQKLAAEKQKQAEATAIQEAVSSGETAG